MRLMGIDQYGNRFGPLDPKAPKRSLLNAMCRSTAVPMFRDKKTGETVQVGYVVAPHRGSGESSHWVGLYTETQWERPRVR